MPHREWVPPFLFVFHPALWSLYPIVNVGRKLEASVCVNRGLNMECSGDLSFCEAVPLATGVTNNAQK